MFCCERKCQLIGRALDVNCCEIKTVKDSDPDSAARQTYLPLGIVVWLQRAFVCAGEHDQTAVVAIDVLHGRPSANDVVAGPEGEVVQVLMQGVAGRLLA